MYRPVKLDFFQELFPRKLKKKSSAYLLGGCTHITFIQDLMKVLKRFPAFWELIRGNWGFRPNWTGQVAFIHIDYFCIPINRKMLFTYLIYTKVEKILIKG
uniref:Uncharacterized protein n=1 Tax=Cacopsylla melanoneura TaxID=428564 RepID=A0A8D9BMP2_9HEMI